MSRTHKLDFNTHCPTYASTVCLEDRQPWEMHELHCGHFAGHSVVLGDSSWVRNTSDHLEVAMQGDEEGMGEYALGKL